jgi:bifunctional non-homologous end joining protein LigD
LLAGLAGLEVKESPAAGELLAAPSGRTFVAPKLVVSVTHSGFTEDGRLRHPVYRGLASDVAPEACSAAPAEERERALLREEPAAPATRATKARVTISNASKVFWPAEGITKGELCDYYGAIADSLLPYLHDRPVLMVRYPDGIEGKHFYQWNVPAGTPSWVHTEVIHSDEHARDITFFRVEDRDTLLYIANLGCIPIHIWASSVGSLEQCDWCVIDLDPKEAPFSDVIRCAQVLHRLCEQIGLLHYVKTTGKTGLHIMVPLARQCTYEQSRTLGELLARVMLREVSDIATITRHVTKRGDKVYLDYLQNRHGQTIVAPFSVRPLPGATVSMPLEWDEVVDGLNPKDYTIRNALERMQRLGADPVAPVLSEVPDLGGALTRLAALLSS